MLLKWDTVIQQKAAKLGRFLVGHSSVVDLSRPAPVLFKMLAKGLEREVRSEL